MCEFFTLNFLFRTFCENFTPENKLFCAEHSHHETGRVVQTLNDIGTDLDHTCESFHIAAGIVRRISKPNESKRFYEYCPSLEGLLPAWTESVDHLDRWLTACYQVYKHPLKNSVSKFPVEILQQAFPEIVDIDAYTYWHAFWATYESIGAYGLDKSIAWERHTPTLLHQCGAMQQFIPYHKAVDVDKFQDESEYEWHAGAQHHTYAKDLFENDAETSPVCPALCLRKDLDGTSSPSYEGMEDIKPKVIC